MGRLRKLIEQAVEQESSDVMKDFMVKVIEEDGKCWFGTVKAKTSDSAINKMKETYGASGNNKSYIIV